jgi:hypothetical protein
MHSIHTRVEVTFIAGRCYAVTVQVPLDQSHTNQRPDFLRLNSLVILVCRFDCDNDCDNQKGENICSDSECLTLIDLAKGETADRPGARHDYSASLQLVEKVMQVLRFASTSPGHDPTPALFFAFLLSICYYVGTSRDFDPEEDWDVILGNVEVKKESTFFAPIKQSDIVLHFSLLFWQDMRGG